MARFGEVENGWTPAAWVHHLHYMADRCCTHHPERADELRRWADAVGEKHGIARPRLAGTERTMNDAIYDD